MARTFGGLWILANVVNCWKIVSAMWTISDPYQRVGYVGAGGVFVLVIFYCAYQVLAVTNKMTVSLKILMVIAFVPVLMRGVYPLELGAWFLFDVLPSLSLISAFSKPKQGI